MTGWRAVRNATTGLRFGVSVLALGVALSAGSTAPTSTTLEVGAPESSIRAVTALESTSPVPTPAVPPATSTTVAALPVRVLVVGDSLVALDESEYRHALEDSGFDVVGFFALSGASIHDVYMSGEWEHPRPPQMPTADIVYLSFGTNDAHPRKNRTNSELLSDLEKLLTDLTTPETCVIWQTWMSDIDHLAGLPTGYEDRLTWWWEIIRDSADVTNDLGPLLEAERDLLAGDGVHLSPLGTSANTERLTQAATGCNALS